MNFREMLERYKNGSATEEEIEYINQEIEKYEVINDYLYDSLVDDLTVRENTETFQGLQQSEDFIKMIKNSIRKAFLKMGSIVAIVVLLVVLFVEIGLSPIMKQLYYNPGKEVGTTNQMGMDLAIYTNLRVPFRRRTSVTVTDQGYGNYNICINQNSSYNGVFTDVAGIVNKGKLSLFDPNILKTPPLNAFASNFDFIESSWAGYSVEESLGRISNLPEDKYYKGYITFNKDMKYKDVSDLLKNYDYLSAWYGVRVKENYNHELIGFTTDASGVIIDGWDNEKYPYLYLLSNEFIERTDIRKDEEIMTIHFISMLKYMSNQEKFLKMLNDNSSIYESAYQYVEEHGLAIYGCVIRAKKDELLNIYKEPSVYCIWTEELLE